ncbi:MULTISPECIES: FG-GAP-like repeat-containing protein, partial [unclassified Microcoleus]
MSIFSTSTSFPAGTEPNCIVVGDFNKDGKPDLATGNQGTNNISILLGTGTGSFGTPTNFNIGFEPINNLALGDFNNDGNLDIASLMRDSANLGQAAILFGNGKGSFGTPTSFDTGAYPYYDISIDVGDFNGDGKLDLVTIIRSSSDVSIMLGKGTGSFGTPTKFNVGTNPQSVVVEDFNADGKLDLAFTDYSDNISILLGKGTGSFGTPTKFKVGGSSSMIATGDFNGDNQPDLVGIDSGSDNISILLGTGTGSFGAPTNFNIGIEGFAVVGDFNSDNKSDLAVALDDYGDGNISILLGNSTGSFGEATNFTIANESYFAVGDFNGDGKTDLVTANFFSNNVSVFLNSNTLSNNTPVVNFGAATYTGREGNANTVVNIPVTISSSPVKDLIVPIAINPSSTATQNSDYTFLPGTLRFRAGTNTLTQNVAVTIKDDNIPENAETAVFNFGIITDGSAGLTNQAILTINDKETAPTPTP